MRAGGSFGMVLDAEGGNFQMFHAFQGIVVEVEVGEADGSMGEGVESTQKP